MLLLPLPSEELDYLVMSGEEPLVRSEEKLSICWEGLRTWRLRQMESSVYAFAMASGFLRDSELLLRTTDRRTYCVFQRSWAFLTFCRAVSSEKGGAKDISANAPQVDNARRRLLADFWFFKSSISISFHAPFVCTPYSVGKRGRSLPDRYLLQRAWHRHSQRRLGQHNDSPKSRKAVADGNNLAFPWQEHVLHLRVWSISSIHIITAIGCPQ